MVAARVTEESENNPLERLYKDKEAFNQERLADALEGVIFIDPNNGDPIFEDGYRELDNKEKFVGLLLYRKAATTLGDIDEEEIGLRSSEVANHLPVSKSAVTNYASDINFVETAEEKGGYLIRGHAIPNAIEYISDSEDSK